VQRDHPYTITAKPRHLKLMFFINEDYPVDQFRKLIIKNLTFWGGRTNPIVPLSQGGISKEWQQLIQYYDPDYCYFSKGIDSGFIRNLCDQYQLNPIEIYELDNRLLDLHGVHYANLMPLFPKMRLPNVYNLFGVESPLYDYYKLNFFVDETLPVNQVGYSHVTNDWLFKGHELSLVNKGNFSQVNEILGGSDGRNITTLSDMNTIEGKLRPLNPDFHGFELVIAKDDKGFDELVYHWNKALYDIHCREVLTLFLTETDLQNLLNDKNFKLVLKKLSGQHLGIKVVSFSIADEQLNAIIEQLTSFTAYNKFEQKIETNFPYAIRDKQGLNQERAYERETAQVIFKSQPFVFMPPLSFEIEFKPDTPLYGCDIKISEVLGPFNKSLRFPIKFNSDIMVQTISRVNKTRQISIAVKNDLHTESKLSLNIIDFYYVVSMAVTSPKITGSTEVKNIYREISYSDSSNRLAHFLKLFNNDFLFLQDFLHDKFWNDLFLELTNSAKAEGDTITFQEVFDKCYQIMLSTGQEFTPKEEGRFNIENLQLGLKDMLQTLSVHKIFLPGFVIKCEHCASRIWYSISETKETITCKGCSNENHFKAENPIAYKLNNLVKNNYGMKSAMGVFVPDGNMTTIRTLLHIWQKAVNSFQYLPQIDIYDCSGSHKPMTDLDIVAMSTGAFYIGECKHSSDLFFDSGNKSLLNLIEIASNIKPDKIILACTNDLNGKLEKAAKFVRHYMIDWKYKPEVVPYVAWTPDYFGTNGSRYFYY
jgi:hypothetical protein